MLNILLALLLIGCGQPETARIDKGKDQSDKQLASKNLIKAAGSSEETFAFVEDTSRDCQGALDYGIKLEAQLKGLGKGSCSIDSDCFESHHLYSKECRDPLIMSDQHNIRFELSLRITALNDKVAALCKSNEYDLCRYSQERTKEIPTCDLETKTCTSLFEINNRKK